MAGAEEQKDDEAAILMMVCGTGLPVIITLLGTMFDGVRTWLIAKGIVLAPEASVWVLPGINAGLDALRIVIVVAAVALLVVAPALLIRQRRTEKL